MAVADHNLQSIGAVKSAMVLVADDDPGIRLVLHRRLELAGYKVEEAADSQATLEALISNRYAVALIDIMMPGRGGLEVLTQARESGSRTLAIVITAASTMNNAIEAMRRGAHEYLTKPFENLEVVVAAVDRAVEASAQVSELSHQKNAIGGAAGEIIGRSRAMQEVYKLIGRVVGNEATLLISGESGTGKEMVARAIHLKSPRWRGPFVAVNCSAIPQGLLESELFGHERGAFTGATERRSGKFEQAASGTIFLDEIGDLPIELQPKLLRVLQEREFSRVGGYEVIKSQARVIAATNQELETAVAERRFREDLYFRLRVIPINLPPLRQRREDIPELTDYFIAKAVREMGAPVHSITSAARERLYNYDWPGNVRELENAVLRAAILARGASIQAGDLELDGRAAKPVPVNNESSLSDLIYQRLVQIADEGGTEPRDLHQRIVSELEKPLIEFALERAEGNQVQAARILGLNRNTLRKKLAEYHIAITRTPRS